MLASPIPQFFLPKTIFRVSLGMIYLGALGFTASIVADEFPIHSVQVYSNQAEVTRKSNISLKPGRNLIQIPHLPACLLEDSVRFVASKGSSSARVRILNWEIQSQFADDRPSEDFGKAEDLLKKSESRLRKLTDEYGVLKEEESTLQKIELGKIPDSKNISPKPPTIESERWIQTLDYIQTALRSNHLRMESLLEEIDKAREDLQIAGFLYEQLKHKKTTETKTIFLELETPVAEQTQISITYRVPNAHWYPIYSANLRYTENKPIIHLESHALVTNETGEDWVNAHLSFSAASPDSSAVLPELKQWKISARIIEREENRSGYLPSESPSRKSMAVAPPSAPSAKQKEMLRTPIAPGKKKASPVQQSMDYFSENQNIIQDERANRKAIATQANIQSFQFNVQQRNESMKKKDYNAALNFSDRVLQNIESISPEFKPYFAEEKNRSERIRKQSLDMQENKRYLDSLVSPSASNRGFDFAYPSPSTETVYSDGGYRKVFLSEKTFATKNHYETTPIHRATAYLTGEITYTGKEPMLAGPVSIFHDKDYVGESVLPDVNQGEVFSLHLGANEDIQINRKTDEFREKTGILSKHYSFKNKTTITVKNRRTEGIRILVYDRIPYSSDNRIKIDNIRTNQNPTRKQEDFGLYQFDLNLKPNQEESIIIEYEMSHPQNTLTEYREIGSPQW